MVAVFCMNPEEEREQQQQQKNTYMCICSPPPPLSFSCFTLLSSRKIHTKKGPGRQVMVTINPLSPNSDQHQFSPNNIHTMSRDQVMRSNKVITQETTLSSFINFSQPIHEGNLQRTVWRICMWILGLKGLMGMSLCMLHTALWP